MNAILEAADMIEGSNKNREQKGNIYITHPSPIEVFFVTGEKK